VLLSDCDNIVVGIYSWSRVPSLSFGLYRVLVLIKFVPWPVSYKQPITKLVGSQSLSIGRQLIPLTLLNLDWAPYHNIDWMATNFFIQYNHTMALTSINFHTLPWITPPTRNCHVIIKGGWCTEISEVYPNQAKILSNWTGQNLIVKYICICLKVVI